jgi:hypothetical protein
MTNDLAEVMATMARSPLFDTLDEGRLRRMLSHSKKIFQSERRGRHRQG